MGNPCKSNGADLDEIGIFASCWYLLRGRKLWLLLRESGFQFTLFARQESHYRRRSSDTLFKGKCRINFAFRYVIVHRYWPRLLGNRPCRDCSLLTSFTHIRRFAPCSGSSIPLFLEAKAVDASIKRPKGGYIPLQASYGKSLWLFLCLFKLLANLETTATISQGHHDQWERSTKKSRGWLRIDHWGAGSTVFRSK